MNAGKKPKSAAHPRIFAQAHGMAKHRTLHRIAKGISHAHGMAAQAALDFLMEYGWAIALVVLIAAVLFALGIFDPAAYLGSRSSGFAQAAPTGWYLAPDGTFYVKLQNHAGVPIRIDSVEISYGGSTANATGGAARLSIGEDSSVLSTATGAFGSPASGSSYTAKITIYYTDLNADFQYTTTGLVTGAVTQPPSGGSPKVPPQITPPPESTLASMQLEPPSASLQAGDVQNFIAIGSDSNGNQLGQVDNSLLEWSASGGVGTIDSGGMFTATTEGAGEVDAVYASDPAIRASAPVSVSSGGGAGG